MSILILLFNKYVTVSALLLFKRFLKFFIFLFLVIKGLSLFFLIKLVMHIRGYTRLRISMLLPMPTVYHSTLTRWVTGHILDVHMKLRDRPFWPWFCMSYYYYWLSWNHRTKSTWKTRFYLKATEGRTKDLRVVHRFLWYFYTMLGQYILALLLSPMPKRYAIVIRRALYSGLRLVYRNVPQIINIAITSIPRTATRPWLRGHIYLSMVLIIILLIKVFFFFYNINTTTWFISTTITAMPLLILWQTFVFFFKTYRISKYTSANQMFWKRALFLFWAIEGFLFAIALFVCFIAPANPKVGSGHASLFREYFINYLGVVDLLWVPVSLVVLTRIVLLNRKSTNQHSIGFFISVSIIFLLISTELHQLFSVYTRSCDYTINHLIDNSMEVFSKLEKRREDLVENQMILLLIFLKFWHVAFIAAFLTFMVLRYLETGYISYDQISSILYNFNYLFLFNLSFFIFYHKNLLYFMLQSIPAIYGCSTTRSYLVDIFNCLTINLLSL